MSWSHHTFFLLNNFINFVLAAVLSSINIMKILVVVMRVFPFKFNPSLLLVLRDLFFNIEIDLIFFDLL